MTVDKEGHLEKKSKTKKNSWKRYYFKLAGSALYYFNKEKSEKAKGVVVLKNGTVEDGSRNPDKKFQISIKILNENNLFIIAAPTEKDFNEWLVVLKENQNKEVVSLPMKPGSISIYNSPDAVSLSSSSSSPSSPSLLFKAKKNLAGKAAVSGVGKAMIKKVIDDNVKQVISSIKKIVQTETGQSELADRLEKHSIKITVKTYFLWENKTLKLGDFDPIEQPLKQALNILITVDSNVDKLKDPKLKDEFIKEKFTVISILLDQVRTSLTDLLTPHLKPKSINRIKETFETISRHEFLIRAYSEPTLREDIAKLMSFVRNYVGN